MSNLDHNLYRREERDIFKKEPTPNTWGRRKLHGPEFYKVKKRQILRNKETIYNNPIQAFVRKIFPTKPLAIK